MSYREQIYKSGEQSISLNTTVNVAQNEPLINPVMNRSITELWQNNTMLFELNKLIFSKLNITEYVNGTTYNIGDLIWYKNDNGKTFLLKCIIQNNTNVPNTNGIDEDFSLGQSGWENQNKKLTILDYSIMSILSANAQNLMYQHENDRDMHPFGKVSLDEGSSNSIAHKLLKSDLTNINRYRSSVFFPYVTKKLDSGSVIATGYMRNFGNVVEYDIILQLSNSTASSAQTKIFSADNILDANNIVFKLFSGVSQTGLDYQINKNYFYSTSDMEIFLQKSNEQSRCELLVQLNRNDYVNTYSAKIVFPKAFYDLNYMVFSNTILSQTIGSNTMVPSANEISYCDKTRESITFLDITFPDSTKYAQNGYNATNGGLVSNSFHIKAIGQTNWSMT